MNEKDQRRAAKEFSERWAGLGYEKGDSQKFWMDLLVNVFGVTDFTEFIEFEDQVHLDHTSFIDGYIPSTKVLIEQKSLGKDLDKPIKQSDGSMLNPFQQAKRYITELPLSRHPRWDVTCNFAEFYIYDMERPGGEPEKIKLCDLEKEYYRLSFLTETESVHIQREMEISIKAGEVVGLLYDAFLKQYGSADAETLKHLNKLCVRLVFCLYAEDAGIFGKHLMFHDYLSQFSTREMRKGLTSLFKVLDQKPEERDRFLADDDPLLAAFPYVNGGLFADGDTVIPPFTDEIRDLLLVKASADFDWSSISPTIFGAVFESTLNPETRRSGGMHYTSIENIHKVIDPLFLDELKAELEEISAIQIEKTRTRRLREFQAKLASLEFLDPAAGSGNFLTESYLCIRRLENDVLRLLSGGQVKLGGEIADPIKVSIAQFHGIEIIDFAVTVAKTALWIAESQMMKETEDIIYSQLEFLPLKTNANIVEGNALRIDWNEVVPKERLNYIMGNPPFVGQSVRTKQQADDMSLIWGKGEIETKLDYVICWYKKAIEYIAGNKTSPIKVAFVSTNSICQGESVPTFWKKMVDNGADIFFAHKTFIWDSEASDKAAVHCVIVGFSAVETAKNKLLFEGARKQLVSHINPYLLDAPDIWITNRINKPQNGLPKMTTGSPPTDDGALTLTAEEKQQIELQYPILKKYIKPFIGAREFLHDKVGCFSRYCFWFQGGNPSEYVNIPLVKERLMKVKSLRESSNADRIQKMSNYPYLFCQIRQPQSSYLVFPRHSSQNRKYIPIGFISPDVIAGDACSIIPDVTMYEFAILTSNVHNAWMRVVCGRIKSDFRYSPAVYNNFPWPDPTPEQKSKIEQTVQAILDARALYPDSSLADLYDELTMPPELRTAHQNNDRAVMQAYGFPIKGFTESDCVAELMKLYQDMTGRIK